MEPFISIILPSFNRAFFLDNAILSILNQSFQDFELIIVDDGSTDNTQAVILKYSDSRIRYFKKENEERNIARNFGIRKALGTYIGFLDSDDFLHINHFEEAYILIKKNGNPEIIHLGYEVKNTHGKLIKSKKKFDFTTSSIIEENFLNCNAIFIRSDILKETNFLESQNAIVGEDHYLWLKLLARHKIVFGNVITSTTVEHGERSLNNIDVDKLKVGSQEIIDALKCDYFFIHSFRSKGRKYFALILTFLALVLAEKGRKWEGLTALKSAFEEYPKIIFTKKFLAAFKNTLR